MSTENVNRAYNAIKTFAIFSAENPECTLLEHMKSANFSAVNTSRHLLFIVWLVKKVEYLVITMPRQLKRNLIIQKEMIML